MEEGEFVSSEGWGAHRAQEIWANEWKEGAYQLHMIVGTYAYRETAVR